MIVCAAVIGQQVCLGQEVMLPSKACDDMSWTTMQNQPLYLRTFVPTEDEVKFHYIVHCSLDAVEEKGRGSVRATADKRLPDHAFRGARSIEPAYSHIAMSPSTSSMQSF